MNQTQKWSIHTSLGSNTTGWQSKPDPTSRTIAVNSLPPSRKISTRTLESIPYQIGKREQILSVNAFYSIFEATFFKINFRILHLLFPAKFIFKPTQSKFMHMVKTLLKLSWNIWKSESLWKKKKREQRNNENYLCNNCISLAKGISQAICNRNTNAWSCSCWFYLEQDNKDVILS